MQRKYVVGYDDSPAAMRAVEFAVDRAGASGASIVIAHVLEWSPYSFLTPEEIEERHQKRGEELERAESSLLKPLREKLADAGVEIETVVKHGNVADTLCAIAKDGDATQLFIGRTGTGGLLDRVFGSVASLLVQNSPVPCTIVP